MSQMDPASGQPTSYKTNVNRAKTKRWVEAKSYSYDGDDWGEVDDYDEYRGYEEPEPQPAPKPTGPTGLRQRGQSASNALPEGYGSQAAQSRQTYGDLGPSMTNQQGGGRSITSPHPQQNPDIHRMNSYDPEEERRAFPASHRSEYEGQPSTSLPQGVPVATQDFQSHHNLPPHMGSAQPDISQSGPQGQYRRSPDEQSRFTAHTHQPPRDTRIPTYDQPQRQPPTSRTQSMASNNSGLESYNRHDFVPNLPNSQSSRGASSPHNLDTWHPPRKSSLTSDIAPDKQFTQLSQAASNTDGSDAVRARASSNASGRSLPFVRPADIYRRMEEEKERERQSQESARPNIDPAAAAQNDRRVADNKRNSEFGQRSKSALDPVKERHIEHSSEAPQAAAPSQGSYQANGLIEPGTSKERFPTTSKRFEIKTPTSSVPRSGMSSLGPILPDVTRMSSFGDSFGDTLLASPIGTSDQDTPKPDSVSMQVTASKSDAQTSDLQHQPSLGFTSAVHHSFDQAQDQVPPTPSSMADSSIERSASGGTSTVSPIISRGPSTSAQTSNLPLPGIEDVTSPLPSQSSVVPELLPTHIRSESLPSSQVPDRYEEEPLPPSYIPGHRRNMSTPSPDNSPARTPAMDTHRPLRYPEEVELATTTPTPTETESSIDDPTRHPADDVLGGMNEGRSEKPQSPMTPTQGPSRQGTDPSNNSRVRDLADKFESTSRPESAHSTTPRQSVLNVYGNRQMDSAPARPHNERLESFRPHLPGAWESSASIAPAFTAPESPPRSVNEPSRTLTPRGHEQSSATLSQARDVSRDAFAAAATAGGALAGALAAVVVADRGNEKDADNAAMNSKERLSRDDAGDQRDHAAPATAVLPIEASRPGTHSQEDDTLSSPTPTLPPKDISQEDRLSGHFDGQQSNLPRSEAQSILGAQYPKINTDTRSNEYESDRLRREIVKELNPNNASEPSTAESESSLPSSSQYRLDERENIMPEGDHLINARAGHESGVLPKAYDSYFNDENSEDGSSVFEGEPSQVQDARTVQTHPITAASNESPQIHEKGDPAVLEHKGTPSAEPERPQVVSHRFSWEQPLQELVPQAEATPVPRMESIPHVGPSQSIVDPKGPSLDQQGDDARQPGSGRSSVVETSTLGLHDSLRAPGVPQPGSTEINTIKDHSSIQSAPPHLSPPYSRGRELEIASSEEKQSLIPGQELSDNVTDRASQSFQPREVTAETSHSPETPVGNDMKLPTPPTEPIRNKDVAVSPAQKDRTLRTSAGPMNLQPKIPAFREILALKTPSDRIDAYNHTRQKFADLNTGLGSWIASTLNDCPEHNDLLTTQGRSINLSPNQKNMSSRSKYSQTQSTNSSTPPFTDVPQAYSASNTSGGKMSGQQVQAKSKELLHTAGVFGGKANVAAKGLFSKGKSKLRGASGSNQAPIRSSLSSKTKPIIGDMHIQNHPPSPVAVSAAQSSVQAASVTDSMMESDAPSSSESYSQGRLGDDERSDKSTESASEVETTPPRALRLFIGDKHGVRRTPESLQRETISTESEILPSKRSNTGSTGSNVPTPKQQQSQWSTTSSNKTPTQLDFDQNTTFSPITHMPIRTESPGQLKEEPSQISQDNVILLANTYQARSTNLDASVDRIHDESNDAVILKSPNTPDEEKAAARSNRLSTLLGPALKETKMPKRPSDIVTNTLEAPSPGPSPFLEEAHNDTNQASKIYDHGFSMKSLPSAIDSERPPSPVSPDAPNYFESRDTRGRRAAPIHHDIHHDFVGSACPSHERPRRRSPSYTRPGQAIRSSEESPSNINASVTDQHSHPDRASNATNESDPFHDYLPALRSSRDHSRTRTQAPEYQLESPGAPELPPIELKSRSRRSSRSSAFLKSLSMNPSTENQPPLPDNTDSSEIENPFTKSVEEISRVTVPPKVIRTRNNSTSKGGDAGSEEHKAPRAVTMPMPRSSNNEAVPDQAVHADSHESNKFGPAGRLSRRIQRASTTTRDSGTKKRFSSIGSLFSRQKRQSSSGPMQPPSEVVDQVPSSQGHYQFATEQKQHDPPIAGYYAPKRIDRPHSEVQRRTSDRPAYVHDLESRRPAPRYSAQDPVIAHDSEGAFRQGTVPRAPPPTTLPTPLPTSPSNERRQSTSRASRSWSRFSKRSRSRLRLSQHNPAAAVSDQPSSSNAHDVGSGHLMDTDIRRTRHSWSDQNAGRHPQKIFRAASPPPPPPPPKDDAYQVKPLHARSASQPMQSRVHPVRQASSSRRIEDRQSMNEQQPPVPQLQTTATTGTIGSRNSYRGGPMDSTTLSPEEKRRSRQQEIELGHLRSASHDYATNTQRYGESTEQRQSLPPLQTNISSSQPRTSAVGQDARSKEHMTLEEKRRSRQEEIEKGHLSPRRGRQQQDGGDGEERIVMSATSFPGQEWQPDYLHWNDE